MSLRQCTKCGFVMTDEAWQLIRSKTHPCSPYCKEEIGDYEKIDGLRAAVMKARGLNQPPTKPIKFSSGSPTNTGSGGER